MTVPVFSPHFITTPSGARLRTAVFALPAGTTPRGACILLQGQTEFIEKYGEVIEELRARNFVVATFDWRGQGGSSRATADPRKAHIRDFAEYDEDLATFLDEVVKPMMCPPPLALAHSMGGHILLRTLHDKPGRFKAAVMTAPMQGVSTRGTPAWAAKAMTEAMIRLGRSQAWVLGMEARDPLKLTFADNLVTSDERRWTLTQHFLGKHPDLRLAGPTWGWLKAASDSMAKEAAPGYAEAIETPTLVFGAGKDRIVLTQAVRDFARRMPHGTYVEIADAEHEIMMENDTIRARFWAEFDRFAEANGM